VRARTAYGGRTPPPAKSHRTLPRA
jgi:hypothetical protein